jgi:hypothetical protein
MRYDMIAKNVCTTQVGRSSSTRFSRFLSNGILRVSASIATLALTLCASMSCVAWESDVHYGITLWLALRAGFSEHWAREIARQDEGLDDGVLSAVYSVFHYACIGKDEGMSRLVRDHHFPSTAPLPSPTKDRIVVPGKDAAWSQIRDRLAHPGSDLRFEIEKFGMALHALQDSWSHQGEPQIPQLFGAGWKGRT